MTTRCAHTLTVVLALLLPACDLPRDPEGTLDRVQNGVMRVGISDNPPWTVATNGHVAGVEPALVESFARELGARIDWTHGTENDLLDALHRFELDLVVAGLTDGTPWKGKIGLTKAYVETSNLIGLPQGVGSVGDDIKGREVAVRPGDAVAAHVRSEGGTPQPVPNLATARLPVAAEDWQLDAWRHTPTSVVLSSHQHVMAVAPGENKFLLRLEAFLTARGEEVRVMLTREASQ